MHNRILVDSEGLEPPGADFPRACPAPATNHLGMKVLLAAATTTTSREVCSGPYGLALVSSVTGV